MRVYAVAWVGDRLMPAASFGVVPCLTDHRISLTKRLLTDVEEDYLLHKDPVKMSVVLTGMARAVTLRVRKARMGEAAGDAGYHVLAAKRYMQQLTR